MDELLLVGNKLHPHSALLAPSAIFGAKINITPAATIKRLLKANSYPCSSPYILAVTIPHVPRLACHPSTSFTCLWFCDIAVLRVNALCL